MARFSRRAEIVAGKKRCARCTKWKPVGQFHRSNKLPSGRACYCKQCKRAMQREELALKRDISDDTAIERFLSKILKQENGCWEWTAGLHEDGHPIFAYRHQSAASAHVVACEIFQRRIKPRGLCAIRSCGWLRCVNPDHVEFVTRRELCLFRAKDNPFARNARRDACKPFGHPFSPENTFWHAQVGVRGAITRRCIACYRMRCPNIDITPNRPEDAQTARAKRLTVLAAEVTRKVNADYREEAFQATTLYLLGRKGTPKLPELRKFVSKFVRDEWIRRNALTIETPLGDDEDGASLIDYLEDRSILSDPESLLRLQRGELVED